MKKAILALLSAVAVSASLLSGCAKTVKPRFSAYDKEQSVTSIRSQTVAENSEYKLSWDDDAKCVLLESLSTGKIWSNIPYDYYLEGGKNVSATSTINITVSEISSLLWKDINGQTAAVRNGRVFCEKIENGLRITYYFDEYEIAVPIKYELNADSLSVTVDTPGIIESGSQYLLVAVSPTPMLCSAVNKTPDSYLFVPSGTGALMYTAENADGSRRYSGAVYGNDAAAPVPEVTVNEEPVRLPVFGAKDGEHALLGVLRDGAGSAVIEAEAGNDRTGYSSVYPTFYLRGYEDNENAAEAKDIYQLSPALAEASPSVDYYFLSGDEADLSGMAKRYRKDLENTGVLTKTEYKQSTYGVTVLGGVLTTSSILGIPRKTLKPMTTFAQTEDMIQALSDMTGTKPAVRLLGFGESGINTGKLAGGYSFPSVFGSNKERLELEDYCKQNNVPLFTDFDLIRYSRSGSGFSKTNDAARTALGRTAKQYAVNPALRDFDKDVPYYLLSRGKLGEAFDKLLGIAGKKNISGISLSTLGSMSYSDYADMKYYVSGGIENDVGGLLDRARVEGYPSAVAAANAYAAGKADVLFDIPLDNGRYNSLDASVPFYQMVFKGTKPLYSPAVNLAEDVQRQIMLAAVGGTGLGFTLIHDFDVSYLETNAEKLYGAGFEQNKPLIDQSIKAYAGFLESVSEAFIDQYELLPNGVSKTVFDNGITLYANHTTRDAESPAGVLKGYEFKAQQ